MSGKFFAFEGLDGSGKTTVIATVANSLASAGIKVVRVPEFSDSETGRRLLTYLTRDKYMRPQPYTIPNVTALLRLLVDDAVTTAGHIERALVGGYVVLKDRYIHSIYSCQGAMLSALGLSTQEVHKVLRWELSRVQIMPQRTFLLRTDPYVRIRRLKNRKAEYLEPNAHVLCEEDEAISVSRDEWYGQAARAGIGGVPIVVDNSGSLGDTVTTCLTLIDCSRSRAQATDL